MRTCSFRMVLFGYWCSQASQAFECLLRHRSQALQVHNETLGIALGPFIAFESPVVIEYHIIHMYRYGQFCMRLPSISREAWLEGNPTALT